MKRMVLAILTAVTLAMPMTSYESVIAGAEETEFEEITVVDNDECVIRITGLEPDSLFGYTVDAYFENKSSEKTYMFSVETASVNGVMSDPFFATEVAAGKKDNSDITFYSMPDEIDEVTDIEISFRVYDSDDWLAENVAEETIHIYPDGEENAVVYEREAQESDIVLVDNDDVTMIVVDFETDDIWGYTANLFLVNKTESNLMFSVDDVSVNGYMLDPYWATEVYAGKCAFNSSMTWSLDDLEENGIEEVEEIEFTLRVYDYDDWSAEDVMNETITVDP
ncbi:MAG: hypothetical protein LUG56_08000 [Lachnospiraceae bacterium]|nr:hypothetical protein [Lachnospiraceae bacterium]